MNRDDLIGTQPPHKIVIVRASSDDDVGTSLFRPLHGNVSDSFCDSMKQDALSRLQPGIVK